MFFDDNPKPGFLVRLVNLGLRLWEIIAAITLGVGAVHFDSLKKSCSRMGYTMILSPVATFVILLLLAFARNRETSILPVKNLRIWIVALVTMAATALAVFIGQIVVLAYVAMDRKSDTPDTLLCRDNKMFVPFILQTVITITYVPIVFAMIFSIAFFRVVFMKPPRYERDYYGRYESIRWIRTAYDDCIPVALVRPPTTPIAGTLPRPDPICTIIYSHGNASDLGALFGMLTHMAAHTNAYIVAYDYPGYGLGTGCLTEERMYATIEAVWRAVTAADNVFGVKLPPKILLYGKSLGTSMSLYLASRLGEKMEYDHYMERLRPSRSTTFPKVPKWLNINIAITGATQLLGVMVDSPFTSLVRTKVNLDDFPETLPLPTIPSSSSTSSPASTPNSAEEKTVNSATGTSQNPTPFALPYTYPYQANPTRWWKRLLDRCDMLRSIKAIEKVRVPVFISHGLKDQLVPAWHGKILFEKLPEQYRYPPQWIEDRGHADMPKFILIPPQQGATPEDAVQIHKRNIESCRHIAATCQFIEHCIQMKIQKTNYPFDDPVYEVQEESGDDDDDKLDDGLITLPPKEPIKKPHPRREKRRSFSRPYEPTFYSTLGRLYQSDEHNDPPILATLAPPLEPIRSLPPALAEAILPALLVAISEHSAETKSDGAVPTGTSSSGGQSPRSAQDPNDLGSAETKETCDGRGSGVPSPGDSPPTATPQLQAQPQPRRSVGPANQPPQLTPSASGRMLLQQPLRRSDSRSDTHPPPSPAAVAAVAAAGAIAATTPRHAALAHSQSFEMPLNTQSITVARGPSSPSHNNRPNEPILPVVDASTLARDSPRSSFHLDGADQPELRQIISTDVVVQIERPESL